jgi:DNA-binding MarR family transcriptional regulator
MRTRPAPDDAPAGEALDLDGFLLYQLAMVSRRLAEALEAYYGPRHGLGRPQWRMLALIGHQRDCTAAELVRRASLDAVAVHRAVQQLIDAGLVVRRQSERDGRIKPLRLSAKGRRVHDDIVPVARAIEARALALLPPGEAVALQAALGRLMSMPAEGWDPVGPLAA